jgi:PST family polysaccharide transporter
LSPFILHPSSFILTFARHKIFANFAWLLTGNVAFKAIGMVSTIYLARVLADKGFGLFVFAQALIQFPIVLADSGLGTLAIREMAKTSGRDATSDQAPLTIVDFFSLRLVLAIIPLVVLLIIIAAMDRPAPEKWLFTGVALTLLTQALNPDWVFQGLERMKYLSLSMFLHQALFLVSVFCLVRSAQDLVRVPFLRFISDLLISMFFLGLVFSLFFKGATTRLRPSWRRSWNYLKQSLPMGGSQIVLHASYNVDTILLGFMLPVETVGWYNAAYRVVFLVLSVLMLVTNAFAPSFSRFSKDDPASVVKMVNMFSWILHTLGFVSLVVLIVFAKAIVLKLYGASYLNAAPALRLLSISGFFSILWNIYLQPLLYSGHQKLYFYAVLIGCVTNILLNVALVPVWGYQGACCATIASNFVVYLSGYLLFVRTFRLSHGVVLRETGRTLAFSFACVALVLLLGGKIW